MAWAADTQWIVPFFAGGGRAAHLAAEIGGAVELDHIACRVLDELVALDDVGAWLPDFTHGFHGAILALGFSSVAGLQIAAGTFAAVESFCASLFRPFSGFMSDLFQRNGWTPLPFIARTLPYAPRLHWLGIALILITLAMGGLTFAGMTGSLHASVLTLVALGVFISFGTGGTFALVPLLPIGFLPPDDLSQTQVYLSLPPGTTFQQTYAVAEQARAIVQKSPHVKLVYTAIGGGAAGTDPFAPRGAAEVRKATLTINMTPRGERGGIRKQQVEQELREALAHCVIVPDGHPLTEQSRLTLEALARYPLITYDPSFAGRTQLDEAFSARQLHADVVLAAIDSDVIKTYVRLGLGVGIVAAMALDAREDADLVSIDASHLFPRHLTWVGFRRSAFLRRYAQDFIQMLAPHLDRSRIQRALLAADQDAVDALFAGVQLPLHR